MSAKTILLTGATGFVGSHLWPELDRGGYPVRGLTRNLERARQGEPERDWRRGAVGPLPTAPGGSPGALPVALLSLGSLRYPGGSGPWHEKWCWAWPTISSRETAGTGR
jgi:uncharacterized protein YbjT (DUF2867 family)